MAVLHRNSVNIYMFLNNTRSKFFLQSTLDRANVRYLVSLHNNETYYGKRIKGGQSQNVRTFESIMEKRRQEARRSILVQTTSDRSINDLCSYCQRFGDIANMFHYFTNKQKLMILLEFRDVSSATQIRKSASFTNPETCIPVRSSTFQFSQGSPKDMKLSQKMDKNLKQDIIRVNEAQLKHRLQGASSMSHQMAILYETLKLNDLCLRLRYYTAAHLEMQFSGMFPNIALYPFGSSVNGFGRKSCDLDLVANLDVRLYEGDSKLIFLTKAYYNNDIEHTRTLLTIMSDVLQYLIPGVVQVKRILNARVPIIKFQHSYANVDCDLSLSNMSAIYMSELLYLYGEIDPRVRPLIITIRNWAQHQKLTNETPGHWITNFSLTLLVIFYLQHLSVLPSLNVMRKYTDETSNGCAESIENHHFPRNISQVKKQFANSCNKQSLEDLLIGFFEFYSSFDFDTNGLCIVQGTIINKKENMPLYIVNPLQPALNVSRNVKLEDVLRFKAISRKANDMYKTWGKHPKAYWGLLSLWNPVSYSTDFSNNMRPQKLDWILNTDNSNRSDGNDDHGSCSEIDENEDDKKENESQSGFKRG